jgi:sugar-specific transcriptional regulator TrmB
MKKKKTIKKTSESSLLSQIGLSKNEAEIYEIMLKLGKVPASKIFTNLSQKRTTIYAVLEELIKKGLVEKDDNQPVTEFRAKHPYALKEMIDTQVQSIKTAENKLDAVLPDFISLYNTAQNRPGVKFYEGEEGAKKVLNDTLTSKTEILTIADVEAADKYIKKINEDYVKARIKKGIHKRFLAIDNDYARKFFLSQNQEMTKTKFCPLKISPYNTGIQIYDNKIAYITMNERFILSMIIEDEFIYSMHKAIFDYLWQTL